MKILFKQEAQEGPVCTPVPTADCLLLRLPTTFKKTNEQFMTIRFFKGF